MARPKRMGPRPPKPGPDGTETEWERWHRGQSLSEKYVEHIVQLMVRGQWLTGHTHRQLAKDWGLSPNRTRDLAAEASRQIRAINRKDPEFLEDCRSECLQTFRTIRAIGMAKATSSPNPAGCLSAALEATKAFGFYVGVEPAKSVNVHASADPLESLSDAELEAYARGDITGGTERALPAPAAPERSRAN